MGTGGERGQHGGEFGTIQLCRVCARLVPLLLMPQASISLEEVSSLSGERLLSL